MLFRSMVTSEDDKTALETLKNVYFAIEELKKNYGQEFIFMNKMHSPVKKIQGKHRYQVLMRLKSCALLEKIYVIAENNTSTGCFVYVEENPSNLS